MITLLAAHAVVGLVLLVGAGRLRRPAFLLGAAPMAGVIAYVIIQLSRVLDGRPIAEHIDWVSSLGLGVDLRLDGFGALMTLVVSGIGLVVMIYGRGYFPRDAASARIAGLLVWFSAAMLGIVLADNVLVLYVAWELTSILSWLLIGSNHQDPSARASALHALLVTSAGGLIMLGGLVLLSQAAGTFSLSGILAVAPSGGVVGPALALILVGVVTKSAQYPTHAWLPGAMVAPTPISAYLHSATMVKAGIYLAARLAPIFAATGGWRPAVVTIGLVTMIGGALRALRQQDLKLLLAMGTVSQLGFMLVLLGSGHPEATVAGAVLLLAHALFKATLFLVVGIVDKQAGTRDRRELSGFGPGWAGVKVAALVSAASMAGLPPLLGYIAKESAFAAFAQEGVWGGVVLAGLVFGSILTVAYSARLAAPIIARPRAGTPAPAPPSVWFVAPALALTASTVAAGLFSRSMVEPLVGGAATDLDRGVEHVTLGLWHGAGLPLLLSAVAVSVGALVFIGRRPIDRSLRALALPFSGESVFAGVVHGLTVTARRITSVVQSGSLPVYVAVILAAAVAAGAGGMLATRSSVELPPFAATAAQGGLAVIVIVTAVAAAVLGRRFAAAVVLGVVGYGMALIFVVQGAPDLALTQFVIETLFIVIFMLVLRHLPDHFAPSQGPIRAGLRIAISVAVASGVFVLGLVASSHRVASPTSDQIIARSFDEAGGRNVVNVILVDFRGLDTLFEVSVLVVAGLGAVALARSRRPRARREEQG